MIDSFPELKTRPELVGELEVNRPLRRKLFHALNVLHHISNLPDKDVATETLAVMSEYYWTRIEERFKATLEAKNVRLWNQLVSTYRNVLENMLARIRTTRHPRWRSNNPHHVVRATAACV